MPEEIRKVDYYVAVIPNKAGEGAKVFGALRDAGVNLTALWAYPKGARTGRQAIVELVPEQGAGFSKIAKKAGLEVGPKQTAFLISGEDRPGIVADALAKLGAAGVNVQAAKAVCAGGGRFGGAIFVAPEDVKKAAKALGV